MLTLLDAMAGKIEQSQDIYSEDTICSCMVGMQYLSDDEPAVRRLLSALTDKINQHPGVKGGAMVWQGADKTMVSSIDKRLSSNEVVEGPGERTKETLWSLIRMLQRTRRLTQPFSLPET